ncbi:DUF6074 family protein [Mesorhizobium marinum]|uniref:DUF6074 family protein n=1 Tax=Mesorhizobium marinum TaxID=3228790 RepID=UPI00346592AC
MKEKSLPLLDWRPPCQVVVFPLNRRVGKIRRTAELLVVRNGKSAEVYWKQVVSGIASQMHRAGVPADVVAFEIQTFNEAVQRELVWLCATAGGDDAA